jgi:hypothetical protein
MIDAYDRFAPLTDGERSAHQMKERQKPDNDELVVPVPPGAPAPPASHTRLGKPIARWTYRNLMGEVLGYISRFDLPEGGKVFLPLTLLHTVRVCGGSGRPFRSRALSTASTSSRPVLRLLC